MHITDYIKQLVTKALPKKVLKDDDILVECTIHIENVGKHEMIVRIQDNMGNDVTNLAEATLNKGDTSTIRGLYTIIKFDFDI